MDIVASDQRLVAWLHRRLLRPVLAHVAERCCYSFIWGLAATITESQLRPLARSAASR